MEFSDLVHYVRSGDFARELLAQSQDANEYAFALGALAHYASDLIDGRVDVSTRWTCIGGRNRLARLWSQETLLVFSGIVPPESRATQSPLAMFEKPFGERSVPKEIVRSEV